MARQRRKKRQDGVLNDADLRKARAQQELRKQAQARREELTAELEELLAVADRGEVLEGLKRHLAGKYELEARVEAAREFLDLVNVESDTSDSTGESAAEDVERSPVTDEERNKFISKRKLTVRGRSYFWRASRLKTIAAQDELARECLEENGFNPDTLGRLRDPKEHKSAAAKPKSKADKLPHRHKETSQSVRTLPGGLTELGRNR
ncbi:MAG TPA: hypothetical protein VF168_14505 [Trueperaceae bacterium]